MANTYNLKKGEKSRLALENELENRIIEVAEYVMRTGDSYRKTGKVFGISAPTVMSYCEKYKRMHPEEAENITKVIDSNREMTVDDESVRKRVIENTKKLLSGKTIEEISNETGIDYWIVYRDLTVRLKKLDEELSKDVSTVLRERSSKNIKKSHK